MQWPGNSPKPRGRGDADEQVLDLIAVKIGQARRAGDGRRLVWPHASKTPGVTVSRLGSGVWLLLCHARLDSPGAVDELQEAFLSARDQGADSLVIDLNELESVSLEGIQLLIAIADIVEADGGRLWLACRADDQRGERVVALEGDSRRTIERLIANRVERLHLPIG